MNKNNLPPKADQPASPSERGEPRAEKIVFFGTPEFGKIILERLIQSAYKPILIVTMPGKPTGRRQIMTPSPVKVLAEQHNIKIIQPENLTRSGLVKINELRPRQIDLMIVAAYGKVIPKKILDIPEYGALNVHPSLLPSWRGPSPIQYTILNGDKETGVTIMLMDEELDHGPIIAQHELNLTGSDPESIGVRPRYFTAEELSQELARLGADLLIETIPKWISGKIKPQEQGHKNATFTKHLTKEDGHIDWNKSAEEIERQIRAFTPWPGSFTFWSRKSPFVKTSRGEKERNDMRIKIIKVRIVKNPNPAHDIPRKVYPATDGGFCVTAGKGMLFIEKLQIEGKNEMTSKQFLNGYSGIIGAVLK